MPDRLRSSAKLALIRFLGWILLTPNPLRASRRSVQGGFQIGRPVVFLEKVSECLIGQFLKASGGAELK
jgi:hypothetical protein